MYRLPADVATVLCSLKSANILLNKHNRAQIADVGLAKTLTTYHNNCLATYMATADLGTFAWSAPEVRRWVSWPDNLLPCCSYQQLGTCWFPPSLKKMPSCLTPSRQCIWALIVQHLPVNWRREVLEVA